MGPDVLSSLQRAEFVSLKSLRILQTLAKHHLSRHQQTYICFCGDGKHALDLTQFHATLCGIDVAKGHGLFHKIALNGGALVVSPSNGLANLRGLPQDLVALMNIEYALKLKGNHGQIAMYIHAPCGAAKEAHISSLFDMIDQGLRAKFRVRSVFREPIFTGTIGCYFHLCKEGEEQSVDRNTYYVSLSAWEDWLAWPENKVRRDSWELYKRETAENPGWVPEALIAHLQEKRLLAYPQ